MRKMCAAEDKEQTARVPRGVQRSEQAWCTAITREPRRVPVKRTPRHYADDARRRSPAPAFAARRQTMPSFSAADGSPDVAARVAARSSR